MIGQTDVRIEAMHAIERNMIRRSSTPDPSLGLAFVGHHVNDFTWLRAGYWMDLAELGFRFISTPPDRPHRISVTCWPSCATAMRAHREGTVVWSEPTPPKEHA